MPPPAATPTATGSTTTRVETTPAVAPASRSANQPPATQEVPATAQPVQAPQPQASRPVTPAHPTRRPLISGTSLSELLASGGNLPDPDGSEKQNGPSGPQEIDPDSERKLQNARDAILKLIGEKRPRFVAAFEQMEIHGHTITVHVPTPDLHDEVLRSKTELLLRVMELAGIGGRIDLEVTVDEQVRAVRPIKLEDRVRYLSEKNPLVVELRKALDLELE